jgi:type II secretory pathway component PulM
MKRSIGFFAGLGLLLLLAGTLLGLWEWVQRRRFERLSEDLAAIAAEIQETAKLGRNADGSVGLIGKAATDQATDRGRPGKA